MIVVRCLCTVSVVINTTNAYPSFLLCEDLFVCVHACVHAGACLPVGVQVSTSGCSRRPEDDRKSLGAEFSRPLRIAQVLFTTEPSLAFPSVS